MALGIPNFKQTIVDIKPKRKNLSSKGKRLRREARRDYTSYPTYNIGRAYV